MWLKNHSLKSLHTFQLEAKAAYYTEFETLEQLKIILNEIKQINPDMNKIILGGGSNMIFMKDYDGAVLHNKIKGINILEKTDQTIKVEVGAGEIWHDFVMHAVENNWYGIENLALIPGTVGAAPIQNIGAYGVEAKECIHSIEYYNWEEDKIHIINNNEANFGYRDSVFKNALKGKGVILKVIFQFSLEKKYNLSYAPLAEYFKDKNLEDIQIEHVANAVIEIRQSKLPDPSVTPNAGSFFKNPIIEPAHYEELLLKYDRVPHYPNGDLVKVPAAFLIEQSGWKGKDFGGLTVHKRQALVLTNPRQGKASELKDLIQHIQKDVYNRSNILLEPEVQLIG